MAFPLGEWLLFSVGFLALMEWHSFRMDKRLGILPLAWILGWILENISVFPQTWHWHFSRVLVLFVFVWIAWKRTPESKVLPLFLISLTLLAQNLFSINEPGIYKYDQWVFALILLCMAFFSAQSLWGMALAIAGGMLLDLGFSVFLFNGIVRHYDLPDPFLWHFSIATFVGLATLKQVRSNFQRLPKEKRI